MLELDQVTQQWRKVLTNGSDAFPQCRAGRDLFRGRLRSLDHVIIWLYVCVILFIAAGKERNQKPGLAGSSLTAGPVPQNRTTMRGAAKSNRTGMTEHFVRLQDGQPQLTSYTAEPILHNVTLKYGIKAGKFLDKGHATNMSECIRACGREEACTLAFMLGRQCFSVVCHSEATCRTKAAFSPFYKPQLAFVKHKNAKGEWIFCTALFHSWLISVVFCFPFLSIGNAKQLMSES